ncbi:MAG: hypothetical protein ACRC1K_20760 [Planctomycetia bacterium]
MKRREVLAAGTAVVGIAAAANGSPDEKKFVTPRLTTADLNRLVNKPDFQPNSLYAHELTFDGVVLMKRDVPLLQIRGMDKDVFDKVHLYGMSGGVDVGKALRITGLIVDNCYGAFMIWYKTAEYVDV